MNARSGLALVLVSTVVSAGSSFIVLLIVAPALGAADYAKFAVYWGALFMLVAVLFGVQQESTRGVAAARIIATTPAPDVKSTTSVLRFASIVGGLLLVTVGATSPLWAEQLFGTGTASWGLPLAVAISSYALVAATNGILAGTGHWAAFSLLAVTDGVLRLAFVGIALSLDLGTTALAWAVAIPFPVSLGVLFISRAKTIRTHAHVQETAPQLAANMSRTLAASIAAAVLINGLPVFLSLFGGTDEDHLGAIILAVTLTRAPILVPITALQSMLIARFSGSPHNRTRLLLLVVTGITAVTALLMLAAWSWGGLLLGFFFGKEFVLSGGFLAGLVAAAGCLGILTATGAAALAQKRHGVFAAGWAIAAACALTVLAFLPAEFETRILLGISAGPLLGAVAHLTALRSRKPQQ